MRMPNIAAIFKSEISRVARKEVRTETESLRKLVAAQRSAIAALKREVAELRKETRRSASAVAKVTAPAAVKNQAPTELDVAHEVDVKRRFSAARLAAHRQRTGLSATDYGALVGVSAQSIYHYEQGKARPQPDTVRKLSRLKELSKLQLLELLSQQKTSA